MILQRLSEAGRIASAASTRIYTGRTDDGAFDRLGIDAFGAGQRVDDRRRLRIEREGNVGGRVAQCDGRHRRRTLPCGAPAPSEHCVAGLRGKSRIRAAVVRSDQLDTHLDRTSVFGAMHYPEGENAARREKANATNDIRPGLAFRADEDDVTLAMADRRSAATEPMRQ